MSRPSSTSRPLLSAGIVGAGLMGRWHVQALTRAGGRVAGVVDTDPERAEALARAFRTHAFRSLSELLARTDVEVVHICTPLETHFDLAWSALQAGTHVMVEKPMTPDADGALRLLAEAEARERLIVPVHQFIFQSGIQSVWSRLPRLSPIVHMEVTACTAGGEGTSDKVREGLMAEIIPHALSLFQRFLPEGLEGIDWFAERPAPGELRVLGRARGASVGVTLSAHGRPPRNVFTLIGAGGSATADLFHGYAVVEVGSPTRGYKASRPFQLAGRELLAAGTNLALRALRREWAYPGLRALIRRFYLSIRDGAPIPISPAETLSVARTRDQVILASTAVSEPKHA